MVTPESYTEAHRWDAARDEWQDQLTRAGLAESTRARMNKHLRRFASEQAKGPWALTAGDITAWEQSNNWSPNTRYSYRASLRSFYRWAHKVGRVPTDPMTDQGHPLGRHTPAGWVEALAEYRTWLKSRGILPGTAQLYRHHLGRLARQTGSPTPWNLTERDLSEWISRHDWSRETARSARSCLRSFYGWAELRGYVDLSPATHLAPVRTSPPLPRPATEDAYAQALAKADDRTRLILRLAAELGLRRAEVAGIHGRDLTQDAAGGWWLRVQGKGDKPRPVPLPDDLARELLARGTGWTFPGSHHGHLSPGWVGKLVRQTLPEGTSMHQLRHRFATKAWGATRDLFAVQRLLGHASPNTTQRYVATSPDELRHVVNAVAGPPGWARP